MTDSTNDNVDSIEHEGLKSDPTPPVPEGMSKSSWKKLLKKRKREEQKDEWIAQRREKRKQQKKRHRQREKDLKYMPGDGVKRPVLRDQQHSGVSVYIDCSFDDKMKEGEVVSLSQQIIRCYAENKRALSPVNLHIYSLNGELLKRFEGPIRNQHLTWEKIQPQRIQFHHDPYPIDLENTIYLSSDSENVISDLEPGKAYVIGGIVDKGRYKNLCDGKAKAQGLRTGRLPISEYVQISGRKVLTCNHVFEILLRYLEVKDWKQAFEQVLPMRKLCETESKIDSKGEEQIGEEEIKENPAV